MTSHCNNPTYPSKSMGLILLCPSCDGSFLKVVFQMTYQVEKSWFLRVFYQACDRCNSNPDRPDLVLNMRQPYQPKGMMFMCPKMDVEFNIWKSFITHDKVPKIRSISTSINMQGLERTSHLTRAILSNDPMTSRVEGI